MAQGALARSNADVAVAITGIAGPDGGSEKKPVGTVVFARARRGADPKEVIADLQTFEDRGRHEIRRQAALCALELLLPEAPSPDPAPAAKSLFARAPDAFTPFRSPPSKNSPANLSSIQLRNQNYKF